jgi:hypothetical protein
MPRITTSAAIAGSTICFLAGSALAAFDSTIYDTGADPASYGTVVANAINPLDANATYNWPHDSNFFDNSGYISSVGGTEFDRTQLVSTVYEVNNTTVFTSGSDTITLDPGDRVFAYTLRLVNASANTVTSIFEAQITGVNTNGQPGSVTNPDAMAASLLKGRGVFASAGLNLPDAAPGDFTDLGAFGSAVDFFWNGNDTEQLQAGQEITLLLFAEPSPIGYGAANFAGNPAQGSNSDPNANGAPILIPVIPTPGAAMLIGAATLASLGRRRREA